MKILSLVFLIFTAIDFYGQNVLQLNFKPTFQSETFTLDKTFDFKGNQLQFSNLKFYITDLKYFKNDSLVHTSYKKAHLIDVSDSSSLVISENKLLDFNAIKFNIGVDSITSVSGILDGDLDPTKGMYWTWQSGYINFKLEGTASNCPARNQKFYWHLGGYMQPMNAQRTIVLQTESNQNLSIEIQIEKLFCAFDVSKIYQVMSPGTQAVQMSDVLPALFKIQGNAE